MDVGFRLFAQPVIGMLDLKLFGVKDGIEPLPALLFIILEGAEGRSLEKKNRNHVEPGHGADADVGHRPDEGRRLEGAESHRAEEDRLENRHEEGLADHAVDVGHVRFGHVVVAQNRREREEEDRDRDEGTAPSRHQLIDRLLRVDGTGFDALESFKNELSVGAHDVVAARHENHEARGRADEERVDVDREGLHEPLLGGVRDGSGRRSVRTRALTGFVRVDAALHAPGDGGAEKPAEDRVHAEGARKDEAEDVGNLTPVDADDDERHHDVGLRHEGHDDARELGDAPQPPDDDEAEDRRDDRRAHRNVEVERFGPSRGNGVALHAGAEDAGGEDRHDRKGPGVGLRAQALLNVEGGAAAVLVFDAFLVDLAERRLDKGRRGAEKGHHPHPEESAGAAVADGGRHARDVARADAARERHR